MLLLLLLINARNKKITSSNSDVDNCKTWPIKTCCRNNIRDWDFNDIIVFVGKYI